MQVAWTDGLSGRRDALAQDPGALSGLLRNKPQTNLCRLRNTGPKRGFAGRGRGYVRSMGMTPREQGDIGELSAMQWLAAQGARVFVPLGHSPDVDIVAEVEGRLLRVEVKTSTHRTSAGRWGVLISTQGGNQSWSGKVKYFEPERCEFLFVHVGDGRRWLIPTAALDCRTSLTLGGPKYSEFEIAPGPPLRSSAGSLESPSPQGEYRSGQTGCAVNALAPSFVGSNPASPTPVAAAKPVRPTKRDRGLGKQGRAIINQKRRMTIPQAAFFEAGFLNESIVAVRALGPGRMIVEQVELPSWAPQRRQHPPESEEQ